MRLYFDSKNDTFDIRDEGGVELPGLKEARAHAAKALGGIVRDLAGHEETGRLLISVRTADRRESVIKAALFFDIAVAVSASRTGSRVDGSDSNAAIPPVRNASSTRYMALPWAGLPAL